MTDRPSSLTLVTGAGGIGRAVAAEVLTDPAARCVLVDIDASVLAGAQSALGGPARVATFEVDVRDDTAPAEVLAALARDGSVVTGLVNTAGITSREASIDVTAQQWRLQFSSHVDGTLWWSQAFARQAGHPGDRAIVNLSSIAGRFGWPERLAYSASKGAIEAMTRTLAVEWADRGIRVNAVAPGFVDTPLVQRATTLGTMDRASAEREHALGRFGEAREIGAAIAFLLSPKASFITGQTLVVDGGFSANRPGIHPPSA